MLRSAVRRVPHPHLVLPLVLAQIVLGAVVLEQATVDTPAVREVPAFGRARVAPDLAPVAGAEREAGVRALLAARGAAVRDRDRAAFLATVDPSSTAFLARQAALFDALADVPLDGWEYVLDPDREQPPDPALDAVRGEGWWAPAVSLRYRLAGFDDQPAVEEQWLTLVPRGGRWLVAADDDFAATGAPTTRGLWDSGPVVGVSRSRVLVLGHPGDDALLRQVASSVQAAVPRVSAVWGEDWAQRVVVLVPRTPQELAALVPHGGDLSQIAALATADVAAAPGGLPVGDRVVVNPSTFLRLGPTGRRVVLTHEVTHVASRSATGAAVPTWLVEGLADVVGYRGADVPLSVAARDLQADVRAGRLPQQLPDDDAFDGGSPSLTSVYEQAWLAVSLLVDRYGEARAVELYRAVGRAEDAAGVERAFEEQLGTTLPAFTRAWRASLRARLR
ncbi:MAG: lipoprotein [Frankiales bacterium]|nr:lipoprotein [Frankiales bacterium]